MSANDLLNGTHPAFPFVSPPSGAMSNPGIRRREFYAAMAIQGMLTTREAISVTDQRANDIAEAAFRMADAMIARANGK